MHVSAVAFAASPGGQASGRAVDYRSQIEAEAALYDVTKRSIAHRRNACSMPYAHVEIIEQGDRHRRLL